MIIRTKTAEASTSSKIHSNLLMLKSRQASEVHLPALSTLILDIKLWRIREQLGVTPKWMVFARENLIKMNDLWIPPFWKPPYKHLPESVDITWDPFAVSKVLSYWLQAQVPASVIMFFRSSKNKSCFNDHRTQWATKVCFPSRTKPEQRPQIRPSTSWYHPRMLPSCNCGTQNG